MATHGRGRHHHGGLTPVCNRYEIEADLAAVAVEIEQLQPPAAAPETKQQAKRQPLPAHLPRREIRHEPASTTCACGCAMQRIGEDVAQKLDYVPGVFTVERHVRGKWACAKCETITQAPVEAQVIDKGIPTAGLLAQVLVAKYADHLPLYRQEGIYARAGLAIPRSTLAQWVGTCGVRLQPLVDALQRRDARPPRAARRRNAGSDAQARQGHNAPCLPLGLRPRRLRRHQGRGAGSLRAGQRAAAVMSLVQSARMNGHDPNAYLKDVLTRLPTHRASRIEELLPHRWQGANA